MKEDKHLKAHLKTILEKNLREDGRKPNDYRKIELDINPIPRANGSCRVKIGDTEVLVGVKFDVGAPFPDSPTEGVLITSAELSPLASPNFEAGPPREDAIELARVVDRAVRESKTIDFSKLCIKAKEAVWMVFIDIYPINYDGNLLDAAALGAMVALKNARLPKYDAKEGKVLHEELTKNKLPLAVTPILCTFVKLGKNIILDPSLREEASADCRLSVATIENGNLAAMQKGLDGTFTKEEILSMVDTAAKKGKELRKLL